MPLRRLPAWAGPSPESAAFRGRASAFPWAGAAVAVGYFALALASRAQGSIEHFAPFWLPAGVSFAALFRLGYRVWPAVAGASLADALLAGNPLPAAAGLALANVVEPVVAVALARRLEVGPTPTTVRDVTMLAGPVAVLAAASGAAIGGTAYWLTDTVPGPGLAPVLLLWLLGDLLGIVVVAPLLLNAGEVVAAVRRRPWEAAVLFGLLVLMLLLVFTAVLGERFRGRPILFPVAPLLLWAALRFGVGGAAAATSLSAVVCVVGTIHGHGPFVDYASPVARYAATGLFVAVQVLLALVVAASDSERQQAIRLRDDFLSLASHELKTPLTPLKTGLQLARRMVEEGRPPPPGLVERIERQIERLDRLVETLLDVLRPGDLPLVLSRFDLGQLARELLASREAVAKRAGVEIDLRAEEVTGLWDRHRLERLLENLLNNALLHGGGSAVEVEVAAVGPAARLVVRDHGPGIPPADRERYFRRFERGPGVASGLGLGLFLSRKVAEGMGGSLDLETTPGGGATFVIELPREQRRAPRAEATEGSGNEASGAALETERSE